MPLQAHIKYFKHLSQLHHYFSFTCLLFPIWHEFTVPLHWIVRFYQNFSVSTFGSFYHHRQFLAVLHSCPRLLPLLIIITNKSECTCHEILAASASAILSFLISNFDRLSSYVRDPGNLFASWQFPLCKIITKIIYMLAALQLSIPANNDSLILFVITGYIIIVKSICPITPIIHAFGDENSQGLPAPSRHTGSPSTTTVTTSILFFLRLLPVIHRQVFPY